LSRHRRIALVDAGRSAVRRGVTAVGSRADERVPGFRAYLTRGLSVFIFHDITSRPSRFQCAGRTFTTPDTFRRQIAWIGDRFDIVSPQRLRRLGGNGALPRRAAMITFDDSWAGVFRRGLPILREQDIPSVCFLNMGTVAGDPDLAAVRRYEGRSPSDARSSAAGPIDRRAAAHLLAYVRSRYGADAEFRAYQGATATYEDLTNAAAKGNVWFGSHLYHHWEVRAVAADVYEESFRENASALAEFSNTVPAFAVPRGYRGDIAVPARLGARVVFTGTGSQNRTGDQFVLDRIIFPPEPSHPREWWYAAHRRRILGRLAS
jgi:peptidoglycan/xylan/chitin deacetylase (PgdA/CDA1 family)